MSSKRTAARKEVSDGEDETPAPPRSSKRQQMAADLKEAEEQRESESEDANGEGDGPKRKQATKPDPKPPGKAAKTDGKMNKTDSDFGAMDFSSRSETKDGKAWNMKISSWNVSGLRALIKKNGLDFLKHEDPDVFCMQETKCSTQKLPPEAIVDGYHKYWCAADKEGYSGTSVFSKAKPLSVAYGLGAKEHDSEGRLITAEYDQFYLVNVYVPNSGRGLVTLPKRMKWDEALRAHLRKLEAKKPVILCGDLNVAHEEIDLANPKTNTKNAGFTREERDGMTALLAEGYVDSFRHLYPDRAGAYTFWAYFGNARAKNVGWRLDYFVVSEKLLGNLCDSVIRSDVYGSDHCPITLLLNV
ncbi:exodeoxyribonuclease isoform X2 [Bacillus rossius redtenbacheri]